MSDIHHQRSVSSLEELTRGDSLGQGSACTHHVVSSIGTVNHLETFSDNYAKFCMNKEYSDITLLVRGVKIPAIRGILAAHSEYFRALLFGGLKESHQDVIEINEVEESIEAFKMLMTYVYTGKLCLPELKDEMVLDLLGLAHRYTFKELEESICFYLRHTLSIDNVCLYYDASLLYGLTSLVKDCCSFIDRNALDVMHHESFFTLSSTGIRDLIGRDSFCAQEVDIFTAVVQWTDKNPGEPDHVAQEILSKVRLSLMTIEDLMQTVRPRGIIPAEAILDAIDAKTRSRDTDLKYRGFMIPEENVATERHGAKVITGELKHNLLDGDCDNYDMERGFTRHHIDAEGNNQGIIIQLGMQCILNHMRMLLWDKDSRSYSYYIEVSMDQKDWIRVVDHRNFLCRSWQSIFFHPRVVRYIKIVGTHNTVNRVFHVVSFEGMYTEKQFEIDELTGLQIPNFNVASISNSACVIEGVSRSRNALINGDCENYDWDTGYTCHQLGSGAIVVQLPQPYLIGSARLLLWDIDARTYSYYVEVSVDGTNWTRVHDRSREPCRSWQIMTFPPRPLVFVKIVGTHNTANEVFHCVHFECPAQELSTVRDDHDSPFDRMSPHPAMTDRPTFALHVDIKDKD